jgi:uncharacterized membrane protein
LQKKVKPHDIARRVSRGRTKMAWILGGLGLLLGALLGGFDAALALSVLGAVVGLAIQHKRSSAPAQAAPATNSKDSLEIRVLRLEERVHELEAALGDTTRRAAQPFAADAGAATSAPSEVTTNEVVTDARPAATETSTVEWKPPAQLEPSRAAKTAPAQGIDDVAPATEIPLGPAPPAEPSFLHKLIFGGNTVVRVGIVVLFFGLVFLAKYAADAGLFPIEVRLASIAAVAIGLLGLGWRLRERKVAYALNLQGGGVAVLYLTVFAAFRLYQLLPPVAACVLLIAIAAFAALLAVLQDALPLALIGTIGGFIAPILVSTGQGNHVMLFSYMLILNIGVLAMAWKKSWRSLEAVAFAFTWGIAALWGLDRYKPELYASTQPFLIAFFMVFLFIALLVMQRKASPRMDVDSAETAPQVLTNSEQNNAPPAQGHLAINGALAFGTPVIAFALQAALVKHIEFGAAFSAVAFGAVYLFLAAWLRKRARDEESMLFQVFLAIGVVFATLAIPFAFDARVTAGAWALEGAALYWFGLKQQRERVQWAGLALQAVAGFAFIYSMGGRALSEAALPILNTRCIGALLLAGAGLASTWWTVARNRSASDAETSPREGGLSDVLLLWALAWLWVAGFFELNRFTSGAAEIHWTLAWTALVLGFIHRISLRWQLPVAQIAPFALIAPMAFVALNALWNFGYPLPSAHWGWIAWPIAFAVFEYVLAKPSPLMPAGATALGHWLRAALVFILVTIEARGQVSRVAQEAWPLAAMIATPAALLLALRARTKSPQPNAFLQWTTPHATYVNGVVTGFAAALLVVVVAATLGSSGRAAPLPFVPLINPLDLASALAWLVAMLCWVGAPGSVFGIALASRTRWIGLLAVAFILGNGMLLRALHHLFGVPYAMESIFRVPVAQMAFSIAWTLAGIACMVWAHRKASRATWGAGAALLAVVVAKLFLNDLASARGIERIISFVVVGLLLLAVGYFAPVPPAAKSQDSKAPPSL